MNQSVRNPVPQTPLQARKTIPVSFFSVGPEGEPLFSVCEGIPLGKALEVASYLLSEAKSVASAGAQLDNREAGECASASIHLIELAHAVLDSAGASIEREVVTTVEQNERVGVES